MFSNFFKKIRTVCEVMWKKYCRAGQATVDSMAHAHFILDSQGYRHKRARANHVLARTRLNVT